MPSTVKERLPQHLVLSDVSWNYYEHLLEVIGDGHERVTYCDGDMEIFSSDNNPFGVDYLLLENVPWAFYEETLEQIGERPLRVTYSDGRMEIMSPLPKHELVKKAIARLVESIEPTLDIPLGTLGNTTFRSEPAMKGLEPDECYYIQNEPAVREMERFDAETYPAPDLAIEVDVFSRSIAREPIYAKLGIPEIWRYRDGKLRVRKLESSGEYSDAESSLAFPFLPMPQFEAFVHRMLSEPKGRVTREYCDWLKTLRR
jgi:Uma2 family endonuclease